MNQQGFPNPLEIKQEMDKLQNAYKQKMGELNGQYQNYLQQMQSSMNGNPYMQNPYMNPYAQQQPYQQQQPQTEQPAQPQEIVMTNEMRMLAVLSEIKVILSDIKSGFVKPETAGVEEKVAEVEEVKKVTPKK